MKESIRKMIISLKRRPQNIPLVLLVLSCVIYTFRLTAHSNAAMYVSSRIIALYVFIITLSTILTIFSFINAYSKSAKKRKKMMMAVVYLLIGVQLFFDGIYMQTMIYETMVRDNPVPITPDIAMSMNWMYIHIGALVLSLLTIIFMPLYHKLLLKIDTSVEDDELSDVINREESLVQDEEDFS